MKISVQSNAKEITRQIGFFAKEQVPFALSQAINDVANEARTHQLAKRVRYFTMRTTWLRKKGAIRVVRSHKRQWPDIHAYIGVPDTVAALVATGGIRKAASVGLGSMAVPYSRSRSAGGRSARELLSPQLKTLRERVWPKRLLALKVKKRSRRAYFLIKSGGTRYVAMRQRRGRRTKKTQPLQFLYVLKSRVEIPQTWPFEKQVGNLVHFRFQPLFAKRLEAAVRIMK